MSFLRLSSRRRRSVLSGFDDFCHQQLDTVARRLGRQAQVRDEQRQLVQADSVRLLQREAVVEVRGIRIAGNSGRRLNEELFYSLGADNR